MMAMVPFIDGYEDRRYRAMTKVERELDDNLYFKCELRRFLIKAKDNDCELNRVISLGYLRTVQDVDTKLVKDHLTDLRQHGLVEHGFLDIQLEEYPVGVPAPKTANQSDDYKYEHAFLVRWALTSKGEELLIRLEDDILFGYIVGSTNYEVDWQRTIDMFDSMMQQESIHLEYFDPLINSDAPQLSDLKRRLVIEKLSREQRMDKRWYIKS